MPAAPALQPPCCVTRVRGAAATQSCSLACAGFKHSAASNRPQTKHVEVVDSESADLLTYLPELCDFIDGARAGGGVVYVHCAAGVSRSGTVRIECSSRP